MSDGDKVVALLESVPLPTLNDRDVEEALYTLNEHSAWPDDVTVSREQALRCWRLVEWLSRNEFPEHLRM
jgi:hypothetical protein